MQVAVVLFRVAAAGKRFWLDNFSLYLLCWASDKQGFLFTGVEAVNVDNSCFNA
jgi:hypothetical protein